MAQSAPHPFIIERRRAGRRTLVLAELFDPVLANDAFDAAIASYPADELVMLCEGRVVSHHATSRGPGHPLDPPQGPARLPRGEGPG